MSALRAFWGDPQKRLIVTWVFAVLGVLVLLYGLYTYIDAHQDYSRLDKQLKEFPYDLTSADQYTLLLVAKLRRDQDKAEARRGQGMMVLGVGLFGLGLAYLFYPERKATPPPKTTDSTGLSEGRELPPNDTASA